MIAQQIKNKNVVLAIMYALLIIMPIFLPGAILTMDNIASPAQIGLFGINTVFWQKLFLIVTVLLISVGSMLPFRHKSFAPLLSIVSLSSIFVLERLAIGQWQLLFSLGCLFWIIFFINPQEEFKLITQTVGVLFFSFLAVLCYHRAISFLMIMLLASWIVFFAKLLRQKKLIPALLVTLILLLAFVNIYYATQIWEYDQFQTINSNQLEIFSLGTGNLANKIVGASMYLGFWAERANRLPLNLGHNIIIILLGIFLFALSIIGICATFKQNRSWGSYLLILWTLGYLVVISTILPFNHNILYKIFNYTGLVGLRETGKFMLIMIVAQSYAWGKGLETLTKQKNLFGSISTGIIFSICIIFTIIAGSFSFWALKPIQIPTDLIDSAQKINTQNKKTISLPWHRYQTYPFTSGRVIDDLAPVLFKNHLKNDMVEYQALIYYPSDNFQVHMMEISRFDPVPSENFITLLRQQRVENIVIYKTNDFEKYLVWAKDNNLIIETETKYFYIYNFSL